MASFLNLYNHQFIRVGIAIPETKVADPNWNADQAIQLIQRANEQHAIAVLFPELSLSSYSCEDLFHQDALLQTCESQLARILDETKAIPIISIIGAPLRVEQALFNCAVVLCQGQILGIVPKTFLPNYREFYERRQFTPADAAIGQSIDLCGQSDIPFGSSLLFQSKEQPLFQFHVEICEDVWVPIPPSSFAALAGASVLMNLSASNITIGKAEYRRKLASSQSARCIASYLYSAAGTGESTTDLAWDGHALIYEDGSKIAESERFVYKEQLLLGELDLGRLQQERLRQTSFQQSKIKYKEQLQGFQRIHFSLPLPKKQKLLLKRHYERYPYVPSQQKKRDQRCYEAYQIQVQGLVKRMKSANITRLVIGVSGGLDSTHALIVCARAMDLLDLPREQILAYTMPGYATSARTLQQAYDLMEKLGCKAEMIDIKPSCEQMFKDIQHPYAEGKKVYDLTFENVQAGERTSHLFRLANHHQAMVVGTGDLSELALGWCTYGVGDHMSHYNVNASVPKTLIQYLIRWVAEKQEFGKQASKVLIDILETAISPELIPSDDESNQPSQKTEDTIGPYELQDFHLYYTLRFGFSPSKTAFLAYNAWHDKEHGDWPSLPEEKRNQYDLKDIKKIPGDFLVSLF